jgi:hypothetical protein
MRSRHHRHVIAFALSLSCLGSAVAAQSWPQSLPDLPFAPGERLTYTGRVHVGVAGSGTIWVEGPADVRGTPTWVLHSDMQGKLGPIKATEKNTSWLDPMHMTALRYRSTLRHLFKRNEDVVEIFPQDHRWQSATGLEGATTGEAPLDELSFLFYLRTLPLNVDTTLTLARHFDVARNPTIVRVVGREDVEVGAGRFRAIVVEMRVRDARRYHGEGTIRIHLSDDRCRLLLRLESNVPDAGTATLALASYEGVRSSCAAKLP